MPRIPTSSSDDVKITQQRYAHLDDGDLMEGLDILDAPPPPSFRLVS